MSLNNQIRRVDHLVGRTCYFDLEMHSLSFEFICCLVEFIKDNYKPHCEISCKFDQALFEFSCQELLFLQLFANWGNNPQNIYDQDLALSYDSINVPICCIGFLNTFFEDCDLDWHTSYVP